MAMLDHIKQGGPGWLQGAMTLGGGSAITSLTIGAAYGYEFLWIQPISMIIGCIMLFALSYQTLSTGQQPFDAMRQHVSSPLAWAWAIAALASSIIWGFSHYPLSAGMLEMAVGVTTGFEVEDGVGREAYLFVLAIVVWVVCAYTVWHYNDGRRAVALFENGIKILSLGVILAFAWVVLLASMRGQIDWGAALSGLVPNSLPNDAAGVTTLMAALGTAVGINMTFVYGYTLLRRGWGRDERQLARYDIVLGLVVPYIIVTLLISVASAGLLYDGQGLGGKLAPDRAGALFADAGLGALVGQLVFPLGVLGMAVGSLVMHMLTCGAAAGAMFGLEVGSRAYRLACLAPTPAVLGVFVWTTMGPYVILPTSAICGMLLPIAYVGWFLMNNNANYLGDDLLQGRGRLAANASMGLCIVVVLAGVTYSTLVGLGWL